MKWAVLPAIALALLFATATPTPASPEPSTPTAAPTAAPTLVPELESSARALERSVEGAAVGVAIVDVDSGRLLATVNEHLALNPASNAKIYTAGAALATLHGEHRYETTLTGKLEGEGSATFVAGPLALRGFGDPSLSTADLWAMVQELKGYGVRRVEGDVVVDQRFFDEQITPPAFEQQPNEWSGFRAPVSAVALDENCVTLTVRPGPVGGAAHVEFEPPGYVDVDGAVKTAESGADNVELAMSGNGSR